MNKGTLVAALGCHRRGIQVNKEVFVLDKPLPKHRLSGYDNMAADIHLHK